MSEFKHTPGFWTSKLNGKFMDADGWYAENDEYLVKAFVPIKANGKVIALVVYGADFYDSELPELTGNALLIAAAPTLFTKLIEAANYIDHLGGDSKQYRVAIAKATGE